MPVTTPMPDLTAVPQSVEAAAQGGIDFTKPLPVGDSLLVMVVGMIIVFLGLTILIFMIKALIASTDGMGKKKKAQPVQTAKAAVTVKPEQSEPEADDSLVAAITAALMCVMEENQGFVVRRIRRV